MPEHAAIPDRYCETSAEFDLATIMAEAGSSPTPTLEVLDEVCRITPLVADPPAPTDIRRDNPRKQGEIGFSDAIGWFGRRALTVSIPLVDAQAYDLIVDLDGALAKVQVKTSTFRNSRGRFQVMLATHGGNQSFHTTKPFDSTATELLYVLAGGNRWVIPSERITATRGITMGAKVEPWIVPGLVP